MPRDVEAPDYAEHIRGCVAVQARPLVEAAVRVAGSPSFHVDTFNDVVKEAFDLPKAKHQRWGREVLSKLPYVTKFEHGLYRYEAPLG
jgi:hypothetical protein